MSDCGCQIEIKNAQQKKVLITLLLINALMFLLEISVGWTAESTALIADSIDMLVDAIVYGIGIYAVGRSLQDKAHAALLSGYFQAALGMMILFDIGRRILLGSEPEPIWMMGMGMVALLANVICLLLIQKHKDGEVHMRASWIFSKNDVIANLGVIGGGVLVWLLQTRWPDIVMGLMVSIIILMGARNIIRDAQYELRK